MPTFWVALIAEFALFFVAQNVAAKGNKSVALPLWLPTACCLAIP
jgi:hypothetical protein